MRVKDFIEYKRLKVEEIQSFLEKERTMHNYYESDVRDICLNCGEPENFFRTMPDGDNEIQVCFTCGKIIVAHDEFMVDVYK